MRFMLIVKASGYSEARVNHSREQNAAMNAYLNSLAEEGALLAAEELQPSSAGVRISYPADGGKPELLAGPFPADQELVAKYCLIDVRTENEALSWALRMPVPKGRGKCEIELRRLEEKPNSLREPRIKALEADLQHRLDMLKKM